MNSISIIKGLLCHAYELQEMLEIKQNILEMDIDKAEKYVKEKESNE